MLVHPQCSQPVPYLAAAFVRFWLGQHKPDPPDLEEIPKIKDSFLLKDRFNLELNSFTLMYCHPTTEIGASPEDAGQFMYSTRT